MTKAVRRALGLLCATLVACGGTAPAPESHGRLTELSKVSGEAALCDHRVPEQVCVLHHPELADGFKRVGDWCGPHQVPESQCFPCHPDLTFEPIPALPEGADFAWLGDKGADVPDLAPHAVPGKFTVFEFYADWCAACRKIDLEMHKRLARGDAVAFRKLNVGGWDSPLAQRWLKDAAELPLVVVYGPDGAERARFTGVKLDALDAVLGAPAP